jgi:hypothetical protein
MPALCAAAGRLALSGSITATDSLGLFISAWVVPDVGGGKQGGFGRAKDVWEAGCEDSMMGRVAEWNRAKHYYRILGKRNQSPFFIIS